MAISKTTHTVTTLKKSGVVKTVTTVSMGTNDVSLTSDVRSAKVVNHVRSGWRDPSAYSRNSWQWDDWQGTFRTLFKGDTENTRDEWSPYPQPNTLSIFNRTGVTVPSSLISQVELDARIALKQQKVNYCVELAQAGEAARMIGDNLLSIFRAYSSARKGRWGEAARQLKLHGFKRGAGKKPTADFASRWLELQYGWLPLLGSVYDGYEDIRSGLLRIQPTIFVRKVKRIPMSRKFQEVIYSSSPPLIGYYEEVGYQGCRVRLDYTLVNDFATLAKVGITNPAEIAWELIPFSFVLDWVVPIGDFISSLDADFGLAFKAGSRTLFQKFTRKGHCNAVGVNYASNTRTFENVDLKGMFASQYTARSIYSSTPVPALFVKSPVSSSHFANALALGSQVLVGAKRPVNLGR